MKIKIWFLLFFAWSISYAASIKINNKTDKKIWTSIYYNPFHNKQLIRGTGIASIDPGRFAVIDLPQDKLLFLRKLVATNQPHQLQQKMEMGLPSINILTFREFYVIDESGKLQILNAVDMAARNLKAGVVNVVKELPGAAKRHFDPTKPLRDAAWVQLLTPFRRPFAHQNHSARVRTGSALGIDEITFREKRLATIRSGLSRLLNRRVDEATVPVIALSISGGGYRAMLGGMAFLIGAQKMGLLDASMYLAALSGSTWAVTSWLASGRSLHQWSNSLIALTTHKSYPIPKAEWDQMMHALLTKMAYDETVTVVDFWGADIGRKVLAEAGDQQKIMFSSLAPRTASGAVPLVIGTSVADNIGSSSTDYHWFETTPFEFGSTYLNAWIPTWSVGRSFNAGTSLNAVPEQTLAFWMGAWGSAFSVSVGDIIDQAPVADDRVSQIIIKPMIAQFKSSLSNNRFIPGAIIPNFAFGLPSIPADAQTAVLELVDAGYAAYLKLVTWAKPSRVSFWISNAL